MTTLLSYPNYYLLNHFSKNSWIEFGVFFFQGGFVSQRSKNSWICFARSLHAKTRLRKFLDSIAVLFFKTDSHRDITKRNRRRVFACSAQLWSVAPTTSPTYELEQRIIFLLLAFLSFLHDLYNSMFPPQWTHTVIYRLRQPCTISSPAIIHNSV